MLPSVSHAERTGIAVPMNKMQKKKSLQQQPAGWGESNTQLEMNPRKEPGAGAQGLVHFMLSTDMDFETEPPELRLSLS